MWKFLAARCSGVSPYTSRDVTFRDVFSRILRMACSQPWNAALCKAVCFSISSQHTLEFYHLFVAVVDEVVHDFEPLVRARNNEGVVPL